MSYYEAMLKKRAPLYVTPRDFLQAAATYFDWATVTPLQEEKVFQFKGSIVRADQDKARPFTKKGLATFLGMPESRLGGYKSRGDEWAEVVEIIEQVIYTQKFEHAAAGLMNATIITRDLGLAEKQEQTVTEAVNVPEVDEDLVAIHIHPDDTNPLNLPRPTYSRAQLEAGIAFVAPSHD